MSSPRPVEKAKLVNSDDPLANTSSNTSNYRERDKSDGAIKESVKERDTEEVLRKVESSLKVLKEWFNRRQSTLSVADYTKHVTGQLAKLGDTCFQDECLRLKKQYLSVERQQPDNTLDDLINAFDGVGINNSAKQKSTDDGTDQNDSYNYRKKQHDPYNDAAKQQVSKDDVITKQHQENEQTESVHNRDIKYSQQRTTKSAKQPNTKLRSYQKSLVASILRKLDLEAIGITKHETTQRTVTSVLVYLPTGGGKTVIASHLIHYFVSKQQTCMFVVNRSALVDQTASALTNAGLEDQFGFIKANYDSSPDKPIQIASIQTFANRNSDANSKSSHNGNYSVIFIDEAHGAVAAQYSMLLSSFPKALVIGLTATPFRLNPSDNLGRVFQGAISGPSVSQLISQQHLVAPVVHMVRVAAKSSGSNGQDDDDALLSSTIDEWLRLCVAPRRRPTIAFCRTIAQSRRLARLFREKGVSAVHLDGQTTSQDREARKRQLSAADGSLDVLCSVNVLSEGFDVPCVSCVVLLRPTESKGLYIQQVGRGLRLSRETGKATCIVLDCAGNVFRHGPVDGPLDYRWEETISLGADDLNRRRIDQVQHTHQRHDSLSPLSLTRRSSSSTSIGQRRRALRSGGKMISDSHMAVLLKQCKTCGAWIHHESRRCADCKLSQTKVHEHAIADAQFVDRTKKKKKNRNRRV